ncbi:hypothetical protein CSB09_01675 [Candidatus Gracilibacteria bacterium]|nr:MAG: hypothetical protein CSB09_01675 [Candidatus Gracilibacteria bacterium]
MHKSLSILVVAGIATIPFASAQNNAQSTNLGEYKEVKCSTRAEFTKNSCNQCFEGGQVTIGKKKTDLFDNWTNNTKTIATAYKDEQKTPSMIAINSKWNSAPTKESDVWVYDSDVAWTPTTGGKKNFVLTAGRKVRFWKSDIGAGYTLASTDKKAGELVGILRYPVVFKTTDLSTGKESAAKTHYECVAYTLDKKQAVTPPKDEKKPPKKEETPPTENLTKSETGPAETLILIVAAFFIAFGLMISLRKRS